MGGGGWGQAVRLVLLCAMLAVCSTVIASEPKPMTWLMIGCGVGNAGPYCSTIRGDSWPKYYIFEDAKTCLNRARAATSQASSWESRLIYHCIPVADNRGTKADILKQAAAADARSKEISAMAEKEAALAAQLREWAKERP